MGVRSRYVLFIGASAALSVFVSACATPWVDFSDRVKSAKYEDQILTGGVKSAFHDGVLYRYPGIVPLLEVAGSHYEMGLQYGVLLRPEIVAGLDSFERILNWHACNEGVPRWLFRSALKRKTRKMAKRLPHRFREEFEGVSEGSGVPLDAVILISLFYDVGEGMSGCTGVLMRGAEGTIIHGRNQDSAGFGGSELGKLTAVVRYKAKGFHTVTHMDYPLYMGVETGYNDQGLAFSEETLSIKQPNPKGFPVLYLVRIALETCANLDDLPAVLEQYPTVGAYGMLWSDRDAGRGMLIECTPTAWAVQELENDILWDFNSIYDPTLQRQQPDWVRLGGSDQSRERLAAAFERKPAYTVADAVAFLRAREDADGVDYAWSGTKEAICNDLTQQMEIFHPGGDGFYLAVGQYYAAQSAVHHIHEDFSQAPELFTAAVPLSPLVEEVAKIENALTPFAEEVRAIHALAAKHPENANLQFIAAMKSLRKGDLDTFIACAARAYALAPEVSEFRLQAGMAAAYASDWDTCLELLEGVDDTTFRPIERIERAQMLSQVYSGRDPQKAAQYAEQLAALVVEFDASGYFDGTD